MAPAGASVVEDWIEILDFLTDSGLHLPSDEPFGQRPSTVDVGRPMWIGSPVAVRCVFRHLALVGLTARVPLPPDLEE